MSENSINDAVTMRPGVGGSLGRIDQYELLQELGGGGFGCVYLARDTVAGINVAVKGLPPLVRQNREELENIRQNFALVSRLHHPNIAAALTLHPVAKAVYNDKDDAEKLRVFGGDTLVVMQYAPGVTLSQWRRQFPEGKVPFDQALEITRQIASALDYAHEEKILHRDIKPANVMIETAPDGKIIARVLDFGLAAEIRSSMGRVSLKVTDASGTRPYMAPEQWQGEEQGKETDQYALAVLFHELITGKVPFASVFETGDPVLMMNVVGMKPPTLSAEIAKVCRVALAKALAKKREERFGSCMAFVDASVGRGLRPRRRRWSLVAGLALLTAVIAGGIVVGSGFQPRRAVEAAHPECAPCRNAQPMETTDAVDAANKNEEARIKSKRKVEADKSRIAAEAQAAVEAKRNVEAEEVQRQIAAEKARVAVEMEAAEARRRAEQNAEARKEKERLKAVEESRRKVEQDRMLERTKRELYQTLAMVETALEKFKSFEYPEAIRDRFDVLASRYKTVKTALEADDLSMAAAMAKELKEPKDAIEEMLPSVRAFYRLKADVDRSRDDARACEAPVYAKAEYDRAEKAYGDALDLARKSDYVRAVEALKGREEDFTAAKTATEANPESIYRKGLDAWKKRNFEQAAGLFGNAAEKGHPEALTRLGLCFLKGSGLSKDEKRAFDCFGKAACLNHAQAQYFLGGCYAKSVGTKYDREMSRAWMAVAASNGSKGAEDFLKKADWSVSVEERRGIRELLKSGKTAVELSEKTKAVVKEIVKSFGGELK